MRYYPAEQLAGIADSVVSRDGVMGDNVYMLSQQLMTAQGIRTSRDIVIEKNKYYILSVDVYLANIYGAGMTLRLTGSGNDIEITGIASNPTGDDNAVVYGSPKLGKSTAGWTTFTFVIHGNSYRDMSYHPLGQHRDHLHPLHFHHFERQLPEDLHHRRHFLHRLGVHRQPHPRRDRRSGL